MSFVLDTNVLSELRKKRPHHRVRDWLQSVDGSDLYLSVLVVGEIVQGVERLRRRDPAQATAKVRAWTLVTGNTRDVERTGVRLLDPFGPPG